ncbi:hypothetical protein ACYX7E_06970 [Luteimonas sp. RIT-PG2_3]
MRLTCLLLPVLLGVALPAGASTQANLPPGTQPDGVDDDCTRTREVRNLDGSRLRLHQGCLAQASGGDDDGDPGQPLRAYTVTYAAAGSEVFRPAYAAIVPSDDDEIRAVDFSDLEGDGMHEVEVTGICGAGPNCAGTLYKLDPDTGTLYPFFDGAWSGIQVIDGHVVEGGRASCCAWEYHAWPLLPGHRPRVSKTMAFRVSVGSSIDPEREDVSCRFTRPVADGDDVLISPPNARWLQLCTVYSEDYHLATPGTGRHRIED